MQTVELAFEEFLLDCRSRLSSRTTTWYRLHLRDVVGRLKGLPIDQVQPLYIRQYLADLRDAQSHYNAGRIVKGPLSHESQRGRYRALKAFFNWCVTEYDLDPKSNPMRKIKQLSASAQAPKAVDMEDVGRMLAVITDSCAGKRDRALLYFLLDTGCRSGGLIGLTIDRLDLEHQRAIVIEKGEKTRVLPFTDETAAAIADWLSCRPGNAETVFCGVNPEYYGKALTPTGLREVLRRLAKRAGVTGRINPHAFRHGYAREFLTRGGSMPALQQMLGHSTPNVTMQFYARWDIAELSEQQKKFSPLNQFTAQSSE